MKAVVIREYGGPEVLRLEDRPAPSPRKHEVLVKVSASSINPVDWKIRQGQLKWLIGWKFPRILGFDLCGEVVETGAAAKRFRTGQKVYARSDRTTGEAHAELVVTSECSLALAPSSLTAEEAATVPLAGMTALQSLRDLGGLQPGGRALILGASGGVGIFAVQIAKAMGAEVTAVCGPDNLGFVKQLGADAILDYRSQTLSAAKGPFSVVFDAVARHGFAVTRQLLTPAGVYVRTLPTPALMLRQAFGNMLVKQKAYLVRVKALGRDLEFLSALADQGSLRTHVDSEFSLDEIREAHLRSESQRVRGKILIRCR